MAKNIAAFLDGTWDTYKEGVSNNSNVGTMYGAAVNDGQRQVTHYTKGVGTDWYDKIKGGAFGVGLSDRIRDAYQFITDQYDDGDSIFIFEIKEDEKPQPGGGGGGMGGGMGGMY